MNQKRTSKSYSRGKSAVQRDFFTVNATDEYVNTTGSPGFIQSIEVLTGAIVNKAIQPQFQYRPYSQADMPSDQERMHGPVHPTGKTQINPS